ncbi:hypothetical protein OG949_07685 [Streptomyces scopuliridis]|nr:hypothetical protein [Streptomyces scopuliridis]WSB32749.1 hypothetical protein OG949_07685 [Streptomyces scopuliridis]
MSHTAQDWPIGAAVLQFLNTQLLNTQLLNIEGGVVDHRPLRVRP